MAIRLCMPYNTTYIYIHYHQNIHKTHYYINFGYPFAHDTQNTHRTYRMYHSSYVYKDMLFGLLYMCVYTRFNTTCTPHSPTTFSSKREYFRIMWMCLPKVPFLRVRLVSCIPYKRIRSLDEGGWL